MHNPQHQQRRHRSIQHLPIRPVQFRNGDQREAQRHVLDEVVVGAGVEEEGVGVVVGGGVGGVGVAVADEFGGFDAAVDDAVGEVDEVGGEGEGPGAGDGWRCVIWRLLVWVLGLRGLRFGLEENADGL